MSLNLRYSNICLSQYYNNDIPEITHFLFIKNTDDICIVEETGRAKIYSLINHSFRPGMVYFPPSVTKILSTPDGACIVAFTTELEEIKGAEIPDMSISDTRNESNEVSRNNTEEGNETIPKIIDGSDGTVYAHIYFVEYFSQNAKKVITVPFTRSSIETFQFSVIDKRQIHLSALNQQGSLWLFKSARVKITRAKTQYRFERQLQRKTLGQVKIENNKTSTILGKDTKFKRDFYVGDYLIIGEEKRQVSEIIDDNVLKIIRKNFEHVKVGQWLSFGIEQRTTNNNLIDVYTMVFTKYATTAPIGQIHKPLKATFVADASGSSKHYEMKIRNYVDKMFEKVKKETKKPSGHLKHFKSAYAIFENLILDEESTEYRFGE